MVSGWGILVLLLFLLIALVIMVGIILVFCGIYWGVVRSADTASEAWKQRTEARQNQKWQDWQNEQNPEISLLRASNANINTPDVLVRPTMAEAEAQPEELLRPVDGDSQDKPI